MKTTKTLKELRQQYERILVLWDNAYKKAGEKERFFLDCRFVRMDKLYLDIHHRMRRCVREHLSMTQGDLYIPFWHGQYDCVAVEKCDYRNNVAK